jgi:transcriptional regulator GlxA family with amidase domain
MIRIGILIPNQAQLLDVAGPLDVFREAVVQSAGAARYALTTIAAAPSREVVASGLRLVADRSINEPPPRLDTVIVAGGPSLSNGVADPAAVEWLREQAGRVRRVASVCSGAFLLAEAGVLDDRRATTHWEHARDLERRYPRIRLEPDQIFVCDGPVCTSAGVTAGIDLALALVEADFDRELALQVARRLVVFLKRPGGQSQFSTHLAAQLAGQTAVGRVQAWALDHLDEDLSVARLAASANMSLRSFARAFKAETGATPADFVEAARVEAASRWLQDGDEPLKTIARRTGFRNVTALRRAFARKLGVTPPAYRQRFRSGDRKRPPPTPAPRGTD